MPLDPNILLQSTPQPSIADQYLKSLSIRNALNTGQLEQQQIQQGQMQLQATQAMNQAMRTAVTTDADGNPVFNKAAISSHLAASGQGHLIPSVMEGLQKIDQTSADITEKKANAAKATQELQSAQTDYAGMAGLAVRDAAYSPQSALGIIAHAVATKNMDPQTAQGLTQKIIASPSPDFVKTLVDPLISQSPKAQQALEQRASTQKSTAQAGAAQAQQAATTAKLPGELTEQQQTIQKNLTASAGQKLGAARTTQEYISAFNSYSPEDQATLKAAGFDSPDNLQGVRSIQKAANLAMTPEQRTTAGQKAAELQQGQQRLGLEGSRNAREQQQFNMTYGQGLGPDGKPLANPTAAAIANYQIEPPSSRSLATPAGQALMRQVLAANPDYKAEQFDVIHKTRQAFTTGTQGQQINAMNTAIGHLDQLSGAVQNLGNGDVQVANRAKNWISTQLGSDATTNFDTLKVALSGELASVLKKSGATDSEIKQVESTIGSSNSPAQLAGYVKTQIPIMGSKLASLNYQYKQAIGTRGPVNDTFSALSPESKGVLQKYGFNPDHPALNGGSSPGSGGVIIQHSSSTGAYRYSKDGGKTWQAGQPPQ